MQFGTLKLKACRYGWMLYSGSYIGKCFDLYGQYSESEVAMMRNFLGEGSVAIDVGANIGDLTVPLAKIVGASGRIYALESNPKIFNVLCANLALNGISNTRPLNVIIGQEGADDASMGAWGREAYIGNIWEPSRLALDALDLKRCDLIKIDIDGAELSALQSGEMLIEKYRPVLYFENDQQPASKSLLDFAMNKLGYDLYWHPAPIFDPDNYFGEPANAWAPNEIVSLMVLGVPRERNQSIEGIARIKSADEWPHFAGS